MIVLILTSLFISLNVMEMSTGIAIGSLGMPGKRIVNGQNASMFEIPYQTQLQIRFYGVWRQWCGGVLVTPNKVFTAAHCLDDTTADNYRVVVGAINLYGPSNEYEQTHYVSRIDTYEPITREITVTDPHDIAVITLATSATLNRNVQAARLSKNVQTKPASQCMMSGWGYTNLSLPKPNTLQKAFIVVVPDYVCSGAYPVAKAVMEAGLFICVYNYIGPSITRSIPCKADSGGPLMCGPNKDELVGVLSRGPKDCVGNAPALYVNISAYRDWLADKL
nr:fibrinolytic enzyme; isozyme C-like [Biomphalaria glabrata]